MQGCARNIGEKPALQRWLLDFSAAVRSRDYDAAVALFHDQVVSFGTVSPQSQGVRELTLQQWRPVWERTADFSFDLAAALYWMDGDLNLVISTWSSTGVLGDGTCYARSGRATILLSEADGLKALHTHFSMAPGSPA